MFNSATHSVSIGIIATPVPLLVSVFLSLTLLRTLQSEPPSLYTW